MNITRKEFIQGLVDLFEGQGLELPLTARFKLVEYIERYMVPNAIPVKVGSRNGMDITHNINRFRLVHKKCVD